MGLNSQNDEVLDWEWGQLFLSADFDKKASSVDRNIMNYVRIGSSMHDRDPNRLPYLGAKFLKASQKKSDKDSRHYMNLLLNERRVPTDFLFE